MHRCGKQREVVTCRLLHDVLCCTLGSSQHTLCCSQLQPLRQPIVRILLAGERLRYTCITKMYCHDMTDPPMADSRKTCVVSEATCIRSSLKHEYGLDFYVDDLNLNNCVFDHYYFIIIIIYFLKQILFLL